MNNNELLNLWRDLLGEPVPSETQFRLWAATHTPDVLREAIIRTATKNLKLSGSMDADYRVKFCSRVANDLTHRRINFKAAHVEGAA